MSCSQKENHCCWCFPPGAAPPPMTPMAPHTYPASRAPYGPPPTGPPPTMKAPPPPTGPPMANATPPPPKADGKLFLNLGRCPQIWQPTTYKGSTPFKFLLYFAASLLCLFAYYIAGLLWVPLRLAIYFKCVCIVYAEQKEEAEPVFHETTWPVTWVELPIDLLDSTQFLFSTADSMSTSMRHPQN